MHADELNTAMTEKYGKPVYHYHLHVMALPVVDKEIRWSKRCKAPEKISLHNIQLAITYMYQDRK